MTRPAARRDDIILQCTCSHLTHVVRFSRFCGDSDGEAYVSVSMSPGDLWRRVRTAWSHVLGRDCGYQDVAEVTLDAASMTAVKAWAERSLDAFAKDTGEAQ